MKKVFYAALGALLCCSNAYAFDVSPTQINTGKKLNKQVQISPELMKKLFKNKAVANNIDILVVTEDGKRVSSICGDLSSPLSGDKIEAALNYIHENSEIFNLPANRDVEVLRPVRNETRGNASHVAFQMIIDGVWVNEAKIELHLDKDGVVIQANGSLPTINEISNQITLAKYQAIGKAKEAVKAEKFRAVPQAELQIVASDNDTGKMAYVTRLAVEKPLGDWEVVVDAETGEIIRSNNEMTFATGRGAVYVTNPMICELTEEPLNHLTTHTLTGLYAAVDNEDGEESVSEEDVHVYAPDHTHFDEVNMYNYITTIHDFYKNTLGHDKLDKPMKVIVHLGDNYDNAYFSPWQQSFSFGDGSKFNDLAKEAAVAYHEYSHAVLNSITYLAYSAESGAINEGQADYFACSVTNDSKLGEYVCAKMGKPFLRNLDNDLHYPEDVHGEVHADGKIWGAVLWDIRETLGKEVADPLIYKSHYFLNGSHPKFIDGYNALVSADKTLFEGAHLAQLEEVFVKRGIVAQSYNGAVLTEDDLDQAKKFLEVHHDF